MIGRFARQTFQFIKSGWSATANVTNSSPINARRAGVAFSVAAITTGFASRSVFADDGEMIVFSGNANLELAQVCLLLLKILESS